MEKILVKRTGALGDVIWTTPLIYELWSRGHKVSVKTECPEVFLNNPYISPEREKYDRVIDLDLAYEKRPDLHILEAYEEEAGIECSNNEPQIFVTQADVDSVRFLNLPSKFIVVHAAVTWRNRTWLQWNELSKMIRVPIVLLGKRTDQRMNKAIDLRGDLTIQQVKLIIERSMGFVGSDSGLMHIAACTNKPIVGLFTSALGQYRLPFRGKTRAVQPNIDCIGCLHKQPAPVTFVGCEKGTFECVDKITPNSVYLALVSLGVLKTQDLEVVSDSVLSEVVPKYREKSSNKLLETIFPDLPE